MDFLKPRLLNAASTSVFILGNAVDLELHKKYVDVGKHIGKLAALCF
jgi:hypothetical protein